MYMLIADYVLKIVKSLDWQLFMFIMVIEGISSYQISQTQTIYATVLSHSNYKRAASRHGLQSSLQIQIFHVILPLATRTRNLMKPF